MNCPGHVQVFNQGIRSYRDLPLRFCEFGKCHRYEPSGALHGMMRVRAFTQDDAHVFCTAAADHGRVNCRSAELILGTSTAILRFRRRDESSLRTDPQVRVGGRRGLGPIRSCPRSEALETSVAWTIPTTLAKARSTARNSNSCCAMPSGATGNAGRCKSISICRDDWVRAMLARMARNTCP